MAITPAAGYNGKVTLGTGNLVSMAITEWTLTGSCTAINTYHGLGEGWGAFTPGVKRWSCTVTLIANDTSNQLSDIAPGDTVATLELYYGSATKYAEFTNTTAGGPYLAVVSGVSVTADVDDVIKVTLSIDIAGEPTTAK